MALDARHRSSIYAKLVPLLGEDDTNALMTEFPSAEADELVTKDFLRAELALTNGDLRSEMAALGNDLRSEMAALGNDLRSEVAAVRIDMVEGFRQQTVRMYAAIGAATAILGTLTTLS